MNTDLQIREPRTVEMSRGFSLIELMVATAVLAVGLLGGIAVIAVATANDGRSKLHTNAVTIAQSTMEKIVAIPTGAANTQTALTDCAGGAPHTIATGPGGSDLIASGALAGTINFSQPSVTGYSMDYVTCSTGTSVVYNVRWNISAGPTSSTQVVTVGVKPIVTAGAAQLTLPYTLHQLRGDF
jgi:prepilin-type N-terminal cleavage/methylation domain-containing protein